MLGPEGKGPAMTLDRTDVTAGRPAVVVPLSPLPSLPRSVWESHEVREAARTRSPGAVVAIARRAHGLRQDELGSLAGFSQPTCSAWPTARCRSTGAPSTASHPASRAVSAAWSASTPSR
jgi:hypothetical protein